ncbi:MAG: sulfatase [Flavobacteriaceae bacterium]
MNRILITLTLFLAVSCKSSNSGEKVPQEMSLPNIILLIGDDQGYPYFGFMGADYVQTPNMDALAASGTLFTQGYVSDNHCRPSLQTLLTGTLPIDYYNRAGNLYQQMLNVRNIPSDSAQAFLSYFDKRSLHMKNYRTLPELLKQKGYVSFQGGKWWEFNFENGGFTHGMTKGWTEGEQKTKDWFIQHMGGDGMDLARVTNQPAYDFLEETSGQPFFMWFAPSLPHYPFDAPEQYYNLYKDKDMSESAKQYYANCTWFDDAWGQMVAHLKEKELLENTLIIYVNDNGWEQDPKQEFWNDPMRSHNGGDKGKGSIYDMSFRSPIIFSYPGQIAANKRSEALIHSADIPATILDYVGIEIPKNYFGVSYKPVLENTRSAIRNSVFGNVVTTRSDDPKNVMGDHVNGYWIRQDQWFLRWHETKNEVELFDLTTDLRNDNDVSKDYPEVTAMLLDQLEAYKKLHGADWRLEVYK